jgi:hypothetical protein
MTNIALLLKEIKEGKSVFGPDGETENDRDAFHYKANLLAYADQNGFLQGYYPIYSDSGDEPLPDLILVEGLSPIGEQFLTGQFEA